MSFVRVLGIQKKTCWAIKGQRFSTRSRCTHGAKCSSIRLKSSLRKD
jgi:hypothetical protein